MAEQAFTSPSYFAEYVVTPSIEEFRSSSDSLRFAYNAVMATDSLAGFLFLPTLEARLTQAQNDSFFRQELSEKSEDYLVVRDAAKAFKHIELTRPSSVTMINQAEVRARPYGSGLYGIGNYGGNDVMIIDHNGQDHHCLSRVVKAFEFLMTELEALSCVQG